MEFKQVGFFKRFTEAIKDRELSKRPVLVEEATESVHLIENDNEKLELMEDKKQPHRFSFNEEFYDYQQQKINAMVNESEFIQIIKDIDNRRINGIYENAKANCFTMLGILATTDCPYFKKLVIDVSRVFQNNRFLFIVQQDQIRLKENMIEDLIKYESWIQLVRTVAADYVPHFEQCYESLEGLLKSQGVFIFNGKVLSIDPVCAENIKQVKSKSIVSDEDLINLKTNWTDDISKLKREYILSSVNELVLWSVKELEDERLQFSAMRWYIRGLPIGLAIRKVLLDEGRYNKDYKESSIFEERELSEAEFDEVFEYVKNNIETKSTNKKYQFEEIELSSKDKRDKEQPLLLDVVVVDEI